MALLRRELHNSQLRHAMRFNKLFLHPLYQRIGELDPSEGEASDLLVAHEAALRAFALAELWGRDDNLPRPDQRRGSHA